MDEIDSLDPDDKHYIKRKSDLDDIHAIPVKSCQMAA